MSSAADGAHSTSASNRHLGTAHLAELENHCLQLNAQTQKIHRHSATVSSHIVACCPRWLQQMAASAQSHPVTPLRTLTHPAATSWGSPRVSVNTWNVKPCSPHPPCSYVVVFDPLDGSRNIDAAIPTGEVQSPQMPALLPSLGLFACLRRQQPAACCLSSSITLSTPCQHTQPAGTIFGVYERPPGASAEAAALQPGSKLVASG